MRKRNYSGFTGGGKMEKFKITIPGEKDKIITASCLKEACGYASIEYGRKWQTCERVE